MNIQRHISTADRFYAWRDDGTPIDVSGAATQTEAVNIAAPFCKHKAHFVIQQDCTDARRFLHHYYVSKSTKYGTHRASLDGGPKVFEGNHEAKLVLTMQVLSSFEPVAPWRWSPEDPTGARHGRCPDLLDDAPVIDL